MKAKKCTQCGLVNFADALSCKRCGSILNTSRDGDYTGQTIPNATKSSLEKLMQFLTGLLYGIVGGIVTGMVIGATWVWVESWFDEPRSADAMSFNYKIATTVFGLGGAVIGTIVGIIIGYMKVAMNREA